MILSAMSMICVRVCVLADDGLEKERSFSSI